MKLPARGAPGLGLLAAVLIAGASAPRASASLLGWLWPSSSPSAATGAPGRGSDPGSAVSHPADLPVTPRGAPVRGSPGELEVEPELELATRARSAASGRPAPRSQVPGAQVSDAELLKELNAAIAGEQQPSQSLLQVAFDRSQSLRAAGDLEGARLLQAAMHHGARTDWSALDLSLTELRLGRLVEAEALLEQQLGRSAAPAELWNQLGLVALAGGREGVAMTCLGRALRLGSENAGLSLARVHLNRERLGAARALFRRGVDQDPPPAWSLAGWALCLLDP